MNNKKVITILIILSVILTLIGATFAYWNWQTNTTENTSVSLTVASDFSCSADGGGPITNNDVELAPSTCDNANYAIKRTITVTPTLTGVDSVNLSLWLNIVSMDDGLRNSDNFRYVLTKNSETCTDVVATGRFKGKANGSTVTLIDKKDYTSSTPDTYYLYIWLDAAETSQSTQNKNFNFTLGGSCTNGISTVYTANLYDANVANNNAVVIGSAIPSNITQYTTPEDAMAAFKTAVGALTAYPFFLRHTLVNGIVTESYVGFVVNSYIASANPGMRTGTYYLRGGDNGVSFLDNAKTIYDAFEGVGCTSNPYTTTPSSIFSCNITGYSAITDSNDYARAVASVAGLRGYCRVIGSGHSDCKSF